MSKRALLERRAEIFARVRDVFRERDFVEVETPLLVRSPGMDLHLDAFEVKGNLAKRGRRYLNTSPEYQMKRLLAEGLPRIFQISKAFRDDELGDLHNPEFSMLEWYRAGAEMRDVMADTEEIVHRVTGGEIRMPDRIVSTARPFATIRITEAFALHAGIDERECLRLASEDETTFYRALVDRVEPALRLSPTPVFLTHYPKEQASLARLDPEDSRFAERFELYCDGVELCNGFGELVDPVEQRLRFRADQEARVATGRAVYPIDEPFLEALGKLPPSAGNALGLDRLVALACGVRSIRDVMAFDFESV